MKKRGINNRMLVYVLFCITGIILFSYVAIAPPPTPHNVRGYVFKNGTTTGVGGMPVLINNTNTSDSILTYTLSTPPIPPFLGSYSATINGSDNDTIIATAWNKTHYGRANTTLAPTTTYLNITLNITRPSETNVTIISPINNTLYNITTVFNVTANITIIGGQNGVNCNATISFSDNDVLKLNLGETFTKNLDGMPLGSSNTTIWSVITNKSGSSNISVRAECLGSEVFENENIDYVYNITVQDIFAPVVNLESPVNNSKFTTADSIAITFGYNVSDESEIANCSLIINNKINKTNNTVQKNISQSFAQNLSIGNYTWQVNCTDNSTSHNTGASGIFNLTVIPNLPPIVSSVAIETSIDLVPGDTKKVICNGTVTDENNISDIASINATLYDTSISSSAADDYNTHYTNNSCANLSSGTYQINYSCSFDVQYFANNGSWECNISAIDNGDNMGSAIAQTEITELVAIDISLLVIDYGELEAAETSSDKNVTLTNLGNIPINVTLDGFASGDGDNLAMNCTKGNIPIGNERYSTIYNTDFDFMDSLTDAPAQIDNFTLSQRINDADYGSDRNNTYWKLKLPSSIQGACNGTVIFTAVIT